MGNLRSVNLNLLPVLRELIRKRNVTRAAEALNMSQSGASDALRQLRLILNDDILVPKGRAFVLTSFAERIEPILETVLSQTESLFAKARFEPLEARGIIKIATADYVVLALGVELLKRVETEAPHLGVQFVDVTPSSIASLKSGQLDFVLSTINDEFSEFEREFLIEDDAVCLVNAASDVSDKLTEEQFWAARHAAYSPGESLQRSLHSTVFRQMGKEEFNAVIVESFLLLPHFVCTSDVIALMPRRLAMHHVPNKNLRIVEVPFSFPKIRVFALWDRSKSSSPLHRWFRQLLIEVAESVEPRSSESAA